MPEMGMEVMILVFVTEVVGVLVVGDGVGGLEVGPPVVLW